MVMHRFFICCQQAVLVIGIATLLSSCNRSGANDQGATKVGSKNKPGENLYSTTFPLTESPISEGGVWVGGSNGGANIWAGGHIWTGGRLWGDVQTDHGMAFGVDEPTEFGDPTAILAGTWAPTQTATATVRVIKVPTGGCCHEVELRLRTTITAKSITGYEAYCSVMPDNQYCHVARWNGPNGSYWNFEAQAVNAYLVDGDVITATATGTNPTVITLFRNQKKILEATDVGAAGGGFGAYGPWTSGNPGIGFYDNHDRNWKDFGFSTFSASDSVH
jgi:hypothetical protein